MVISTKGRYALSLMIDIAMQESSEPVSLHAVSDRQNISLKYLEQLASPLCRAGLLVGIRGAQGGYIIAKDPALITAGDILRAGEGTMSPVTCLASEVNECPKVGNCLTLGFWTGLDQAITDYIDGVSLADFVTGVRS